MKKIGLLVAAAMVLLAFVGCGDTSDKKAEDKEFVSENENGNENDNPEKEDNNVENENNNVDNVDDTDDVVDGQEDENITETNDNKEEEQKKEDEVVVETVDDKKQQESPIEEPKEPDVKPLENETEEPETVDFDIVSADGQYDYNVYSTEETITLKVVTENADGESADYQWYRCDENGNILTYYNYGHPLGMGDSLEVSGIAYDEMLLPRYYLVNAMVKNTVKSKVFSVTLCPMGVEYEEEEEAQGGEEHFYVVSSDGWYEYEVFVGESITLTAKVENNGEQYADYQWFRCDEYGNSFEGDSYGHPLSWGESLTIESIPDEEMLVPRYYVAKAMIGNTMREAIFKVTLVPHGVEA